MEEKLLVTALPRRNLQEAISSHLCLFVNVYGSTSLINLKGYAKANSFQKSIWKKILIILKILQRFIDWKFANKAITFNAGNFLKKNTLVFRNKNTLHYCLKQTKFFSFFF